VVAADGKLRGTLGIDELMEALLGNGRHGPDTPMEELVQPVANFTRMDTPMREVMQHMEKVGRHILPVVDLRDNYLGFVTKEAIFANYRRLLVKKGNLAD
jgi:CIC family chloride channel protein